MFNKLKEIFVPPKPIEKGFFHARIDQINSNDHMRLHLRISNDDEGTLIINASKSSSFE